MQRLIYVLFAILVIACPLSVFAAFKEGQALQHPGIAVCLEKADAIAVLDADAKGGLEAARVKWLGIEKCQTVSVSGPTVGKVVKSAKVKRGETTITVRVVEIVGDGQVLGYFFTTEEVHPKAQSNT